MEGGCENVMDCRNFYNEISALSFDTKETIKKIRDWMEEIEALKARLLAYGHTAHFIGTWFDGYADGYPVYEEWECSNCHSEFTNDGDPPDYTFCPYCGKLMVDPPEGEMDEVEDDV